MARGHATSGYQNIKIRIVTPIIADVTSRKKVVAMMKQQCRPQRAMLLACSVQQQSLLTALEVQHKLE